MPMNCVSWIVGHLAVREQYYWAIMAQGRVIIPGLYEIAGYDRPASTPPLADMWAAWGEITAAADEYLETLTADMLITTLLWEGKPYRENIGTMLQRNIYHYWYHTGEAAAIRQLLGHADLPEFVGDMSAAAYG